MISLRVTNHVNGSVRKIRSPLDPDEARRRLAAALPLPDFDISEHAPTIFAFATIRGNDVRLHVFGFGCESSVAEVHRILSGLLTERKVTA